MTKKATDSIGAQIALLNATTVHFTAEAFEDFCASIDAPVSEVPVKMRERLLRPSPWDIATRSER